MLDVDHADASKLHIISYELGCAADERMAADAPDLHRVVGNQAVAALDELQGRLALADAAVAHEQDALAVDLHQHAVHGHARGEVFLQRVDQVRLEGRGVLVGDEDVAVIFAGHLDALGKRGHAVADHQRRDLVLHEALRGL